MKSLALRLTAAIALVGVASAGAGSAAAADASHQLIDYGSVVNCRFNVTQRSGGTWTAAKLRHIVVEPPVIKAENGGAQTVGWRFFVVRSKNRDNGPWQVTYRSPWQKATATPSHAAQLSNMGVDVAVPRVDAPNWVWYHVTLVMRWFNADGSTMDETDVGLSQMRWIVNGHYFDTETYCPGLEQVNIDGQAASI